METHRIDESCRERGGPLAKQEANLILKTSANAFDEDSRKSLARKINGHLSKPIEVGRLPEVLVQCIRRGSGAS